MTEKFIHKKIGYDKTLGEKLKSVRKKKKITLIAAEEATKVRLKYLEALEAGNYHLLPANVYALGFLTKYAEFLEIPKEEYLQDFKREQALVGDNNLIRPKSRVKDDRVLITPKVLYIIGIALALAVLIGYIAYSVRALTQPPNLVISSPSAETIIRQDKVEVVGKTDEGVSLTINDQIVFIDPRGNFRETVKLQPGMNNIEIRALNRAKKEAVKVVKILAEF